jgi:outer membrane protein assembly factor BamB
VVSTDLPERLANSWTAQIGGRLTQPVIAAGTLVISSIDQHAVYAFDAASGQPLWSRTVGGRVDSPPTIYDGRLCLFGSADGYVYCLRLSDGELVWRFLAAAAARRTVVWGRLESIWPVHGSVLVMNDVVYVSAGRSTWFDRGIDLYGQDPETGEVMHHCHFESPHPKFEEGKNRLAELDAKSDEFREMILKQNTGL